MGGALPGGALVSASWHLRRVPETAEKFFSQTTLADGAALGEKRGLPRR